ncbi:HIT family protein [Pseudactinotalea suaedae]|uniref:HIT family protein n=1 Tax=Pseudactinotalea suaedae TaxID=1524924 RepID=UPI001F4FDC74|nr:HIT family protein [Pseudactinotalea suaedae]
MSTTCVFCRIVAGEEQAYEVLRTDTVVAFLDIRPVFHGHTLVIPTEHVDTLTDLPADRLGDYFGTVQLLSRVIPDALGSQGTWVSINNVVSQSVPHLHTHVVPRTKGDGLRGFFWPRTRYAEGEASATAERIRSTVERSG